jgi:hypothetical protein
VDELRDLPIIKTDILLTHSYHWADTSTIATEKKDVYKDLLLKEGWPGTMIIIALQRQIPAGVVDYESSLKYISLIR